MDKSLEFIKKRFKEMGMNWDYKDEEVQEDDDTSFVNAASYKF